MLRSGAFVVAVCFSMPAIAQVDCSTSSGQLDLQCIRQQNNLKIDRTRISVSGISSGAFMAHQFHVAHSAHIMGVGIVAGGPYYCAEGNIADGRLAVGDVASVPAGKYAKQALETLEMWAGVERKLAQTDTVRAALALVARGEAKAGIVYATDAKAEPKVKVLGTFPADTHAPIIYPVALVASSTNADARAFFGYLRSPAALRVFDAQGFAVLK